MLLILSIYGIKSLILLLLLIWGGWMLRTDRHGKRF